MKKIILAIMLVTALVTGCVNNKSVSIDEIEVKNTYGKVRKWIQGKEKENGVYLGKIEDGSKGDKLYLYINYKNIINNEVYAVPTVQINTNSNDDMTIDAVARQSNDETDEKLFYIDFNGRKINKLFLNDKEIKITSIPVIE